MHNYTPYLHILTASLLLSFAQPAFAAGLEIGVNSAVKGDVTIRTGEQLSKQAIIEEPVHLGDTVNSKQLSALQVLLKDQTVFTVGPECTLTIDEYVYNPSAKANSLSAKVTTGMFRFMSGNISKSNPADVKIDTPVASMGVRGTIAEGLVGTEAIAFARNAGVLPAGASADTAHATLFVLRGPGRKNTSKNTRGKISVTSAGVTKTTDMSGMAIFVADKNSPPSDPFRLNQVDFEEFNNRLRTEPTSPDTYRPFDIWVSSAPGLTGAYAGGNQNWLLPAAGLTAAGLGLYFALDEDASSP